MYQPELGRFFTQDRFADKYLSMSPYQYGANNPLKYVDVNGDSIWIQDGTLHITGAVYDATGRYGSGQLARRLTKELTKRLGAAFAEAGIDMKLNIQIEGVTSMGDVKDSDHLWAIVDEVKDENGNEIGGGVGGYKRNRDGAAMFGNTTLISSKVLDFDNTMVHEGGHMLGLGHVLDPNGRVNRDSDNPMAYVNPFRGALLPGSWGDQRDGNFNPQQVQKIVDAINDKRLNVFGSYEKKQRGMLPATKSPLEGKLPSHSPPYVPERR